jgi:hypothetical protein
MSNRTNGKPLWWVRPIVDGHADESAGRMFVGTEAEMVAHISRLHRETGTQHAATSAGE